MIERNPVQKTKVKSVEPKCRTNRIAIGLQLGSKVCERRKCVYGKDVTENGWHSLLA